MLFSTFLLSPLASAADITVDAGGGANYTYNDNLRVSPEDEISLSGVVGDVHAKGAYRTQRLELEGNIELGIERYDDIDLNSDNPILIAPSAKDFNNESQFLELSAAYNWQRHRLAIEGEYDKDSTLNTQFQDTGFGGLREVEGANRVTKAAIRPSWQWQVTERQSLNIFAEVRSAEFESQRYVDYEFSQTRWTWRYVLSERWQVQLVPSFSRYENDSSVNVESDTTGLQAGFVWDARENLTVNVLAGATSVETEYGLDGYFVFNPETGRIEFIELEAQRDEGFIGQANVTWKREDFDLDLLIYSRVNPSSNGFLRKNEQVEVKYSYLGSTRWRFDVKALAGQNGSTDERLRNDRLYAEAGFRLGYQMAEDWWLSLRYRYRMQDFKDPASGEGAGNRILLGMSYRLPTEVL